MAIFDYKTGDCLRFLTKICPPSGVRANDLCWGGGQGAQKDRPKGGQTLGVVLPTFPRSRTSCVFVLHDLLKAD